MAFRSPPASEPTTGGHLRWAAALTLIILAGACASGTKTTTTTTKGGHPPAGATSPTSSETPETTDPVADAQTAQGIALKAHDFPAQWLASPYVADPTEKQKSRDFTACLGVPDNLPLRTASVNSDDFTSGDTVVSSSVDTFTKPSVVTTDVAALIGPKEKACLEAIQKASLLPGEAVNSLDVKITPGAAPGRTTQKASASVHVVATVSGRPADIHAEILYLSKDRIEAEVDVVSLSGPIPAGILERAGEQLSSRLAASS